MIDETYTVKLKENGDFLEWFGNKFRDEFEDEEEDGGESLSLDDLDSLFSGSSSSSYEDSYNNNDSDIPWYERLSGSENSEYEPNKKGLADQFFDYVSESAQAFFSLIKDAANSLDKRKAEDFDLFIENLKVATGWLLGGCIVLYFMDIRNLIIPLETTIASLVAIFLLCVGIDLYSPKFSWRLKLVSQEDEYYDELELEDLEELEGVNLDIEELEDQELAGYEDTKPRIGSSTDIGFSLQNVESNSEQEDLLDPEYLYDMFKNCLHTFTMDFDVEKLITKDDIFHTILMERFYSGFTGIFSQNYEIDFDFVSVKETRFYIDVSVKNIKGVPKKALTEPKNLEAFGAMFLTEDDDFDIEYVPITVRDMADVTLFKIYKINKPLITLGDLLQNDRIRNDFFKKQRKDAVAFLAGLRQDMSPLVMDLVQEGHILIVGATRSGKGWLTQFFIYSLAALNPPSKVSFIVLDPKNEGAFRASSQLPHVIRVESDYNNFMRVLEHVATEAEFRKGLFEKIDVENYNEYYRRYSKSGYTLEIPYLIVIIDELISLNIKLGKDDSDAFNAKLTSMASEYASFGIKFIFIAQVAKNESIKKTITQQCSIKYAVRANKGLQDFTFDKPKSTELVDLPEAGDIAIMYSKGIQKIRQPTVSCDPPDNVRNAFRVLALAWAINNPPLPKLPTFARIDNRMDIRETLRKMIESGNMEYIEPKRPDSIFDVLKDKKDLVDYVKTDETRPTRMNPDRYRDNIDSDEEDDDYFEDTAREDKYEGEIKLIDDEVEEIDLESLFSESMKDNKELESDEVEEEYVEEYDEYDEHYEENITGHEASDDSSEDDSEVIPIYDEEDEDSVDNEGGFSSNESDKEELVEEYVTNTEQEEDIESADGAEGMEDAEGFEYDEEFEDIENNADTRDTKDTGDIPLRSDNKQRMLIVDEEIDIRKFILKMGGKISREELLKSFNKYDINMEVWENRIFYDSKKDIYLT